jgi:hypothetical protein
VRANRESGLFKARSPCPFIKGNERDEKRHRGTEGFSLKKFCALFKVIQNCSLKEDKK